MSTTYCSVAGGLVDIMCLFCQGRIHQIEYAMEAVKQGAATVGLKSKTHAILVALKVIYTIVLAITK